MMGTADLPDGQPCISELDRGISLQLHGIMTTALWTSRLATRLRGNPARCVAERTAPPPKHHLVLYDYEASPWCRLVREYASIMDLTLHVRPCPRQTLFREGAFTQDSRFRPEAMELLKEHCNTDDLMFPLLVDRTHSSTNAKSTQPPPPPVVLQQSYAILEHLWQHYGQTVIPSSDSLQQLPPSANSPKQRQHRRRRL